MTPIERVGEPLRDAAVDPRPGDVTDSWDTPADVSTQPRHKADAGDLAK